MGRLRAVNPNNFLVDPEEGSIHYKYGTSDIVELVGANIDCQLDGVARGIGLDTASARTLVEANSGTVYIAMNSSSTQTYTLPLAATHAGCFFTLVCGHADGEILLTPQTADAFAIKASEGGASVVTAAGTGIKNTAASNVKGDRITVVSDGVDTYWAIDQSGIWASR